MYRVAGAAGPVAGSVRSKPIYLPSLKKVTIDMEHILSRHAFGGALTPGRTVFPSTMSSRGIESPIKEAYLSAEKVGVHRIAGQDARLVLQGNGGGLRIEMYFNEATNVIETAYPITR